MVCFKYNRRLRDRCYNTTPTFFRDYYIHVTAKFHEMFLPRKYPAVRYIPEGVWQLCVAEDALLVIIMIMLKCTVVLPPPLSHTHTHSLYRTICGCLSTVKWRTHPSTLRQRRTSLSRPRVLAPLALFQTSSLKWSDDSISKHFTCLLLEKYSVKSCI